MFLVQISCSDTYKNKKLFVKYINYNFKHIMSITPFSLIYKSIQSPHRRLNHHDSLIFSITSQKLDSRKQTLLLDDSKQLEKQTGELVVKDYFTIQEKIKILEEKVQNIKTQYCESWSKQQDKQNQPQIINLQFPEQIYEKRLVFQEESQTGKIKRKKTKYFTGIQEKTRSRSNSKNQISIMSTKRNSNTTYNINDFSVYKARNNFTKQAKNKLISDKNSNVRSSSFSQRKHQKNSFMNKEKSQLNKLKKQLIRNKLSSQILSRKSKQSQKKLSISKGQTRKIYNENTKLQKQVVNLCQKLKKSETIKQRQKQTIQKQKQEIQGLRSLLQEFQMRKNDQKLRESFTNQKDIKMTKLKVLR